jgi:hypothetical protein
LEDFVAAFHRAGGFQPVDVPQALEGVQRILALREEGTGSKEKPR